MATMTKAPRSSEPVRSETSRRPSADRPVIPGYHVGERLGHGGTGTVYRAVQLTLQREVALRILPVGTCPAERFLAEARAAAAVQHPNVVTCYEAGITEGLLYQAFELVPGVTLDRHLQDRGGRLTPRDAVGLLMACARGLEGIHRAGLVHGGITPASIIVADDATVKLADLGLGRALAGGERGWDVDDAALNATAAPEQLAGDTGDIRSDLYALGAILHLLVTGRPPHVARSRTDLVRRVQGTLDLRGDDLPPHLVAVMCKALAVTPSDRYAAPSYLREDLERLLLDFAPIHARSPDSVHLEALAPRSAPAPRAPAAEARMRRAERPWWRMPLVLAGAGIALAGGGAWWTWGRTAATATSTTVTTATVVTTPVATPATTAAANVAPARPAWASAVGSDRCGAWADLTIAGVTQRLRWLPPATVRIGSPPDERGRHDDEGPFTATLTHGIWIADSETTQALWRAVMGDNPSHFTGSDDSPVESVNWHDVQRFLRRLSEHASGAIAVLPSEAQWEYAARADGAVLGQPMSTQKNESDDKRTHSVHVGQSNAWGLYGCADNVLEWCQDAYGPYPGGSATDPLNNDGIARSVRGGGWSTAPGEWRPALRAHYPPVMKFAFLGFRFVIEP
jgi:formylglycine-generating enzyme required for sulfatase activity